MFDVPRSYSSVAIKPVAKQRRLSIALFSFTSGSCSKPLIATLCSSTWALCNRSCSGLSPIPFVSHMPVKGSGFIWLYCICYLDTGTNWLGRAEGRPQVRPEDIRKLRQELLCLYGVDSLRRVAWSTGSRLPATRVSRVQEQTPLSPFHQKTFKNKNIKKKHKNKQTNIKHQIIKGKHIKTR